MAAVIGQRSEFSLLQRASGLDEATAAAAVEEAVRRAVLHGVGERFDFRHDRLRDAMLAGLLPPRRRLLHAAAAAAIESVYAADLPAHHAELARHYHAAEQWDRSLVASHAAGRQAAGRSAHADAVARFEQALDAAARLTADPSTLARAIDVRFDLRNALIPLGRFDRIAGCLSEAAALAETIGDQRRLGRASCYMTQFFWVSAHYDEAIVAGERALGLGTTLGDVGMQAEARYFLGVTRAARGEYAAAAGMLAALIELVDGAHRFERFGLPFLPSVAGRVFAAWSLAELGRFDEAAARADEIVPIAKALDHPFSMIEVHIATGVVAVRRGMHDEAIDAFAAGMRDCEAANIMLLIPFVSAQLGWACALAGRLDEAFPPLERAVGMAATMRLATHEARWVGMLAEASLLADRVDAAAQQASRAVALARARGETGHEAWALFFLAAVGARQGSRDAAARYADAEALAARLGMRPLVARCRLGLATAHASSGDVDGARRAATSAAGLFAAMGMTTWRERAEALAATSRRAGSPPLPSASPTASDACGS